LPNLFVVQPIQRHKHCTLYRTYWLVNPVNGIFSRKPSPTYNPNWIAVTYSVVSFINFKFTQNKSVKTATKVVKNSAILSLLAFDYVIFSDKLFLKFRLKTSTLYLCRKCECKWEIELKVLLTIITLPKRLRLRLRR
jgi:hypothetical protein